MPKVLERRCLNLLAGKVYGILSGTFTNAARVAAPTNVSLFAQYSILNVIHLNESVCSGKIRNPTHGTLQEQTCAVSQTTLNTSSTSAHPFGNTGAHADSYTLA